MFLSDISVKRPVLATVISLLIVVLGLASMLQLAVREYPDINPPVVSITTTYLSASPEIIDTEITKQIEAAVSSVDGIRLITSASNRLKPRYSPWWSEERRNVSCSSWASAA